MILSLVMPKSFEAKLPQLVLGLLLLVWYLFGVLIWPI